MIPAQQIRDSCGCCLDLQMGCVQKLDFAGERKLVQSLKQQRAFGRRQGKAGFFFPRDQLNLYKLSIFS